MLELQNLEAHGGGRQARICGDSLPVPVKRGNTVALRLGEKTKSVQGGRVVGRLSQRLLKTGARLSGGTARQREQAFRGVGSRCIAAGRRPEIERLTRPEAVAGSQRRPGWLNIGDKVAGGNRHMGVVEHVAPYQGVGGGWRGAAVRRGARRQHHQRDAGENAAKKWGRVSAHVSASLLLTVACQLFFKMGANPPIDRLPNVILDLKELRR